MVDGRVVGAYGVAEDLADHHRMMGELQEATTAAEAASEAKSFFLANMSHEIRTPLTTLLASKEMLEDTDLDPVQARLLQRMEGSSTRLLALIGSILDVVATTGLAATARGLTVTSHLDPGCPSGWWATPSAASRCCATSSTTP